MPLPVPDDILVSLMSPIRWQYTHQKAKQCGIPKGTRDSERSQGCWSCPPCPLQPWLHWDLLVSLPPCAGHCPDVREKPVPSPKNTDKAGLVLLSYRAQKLPTSPCSFCSIARQPGDPLPSSQHQIPVVPGT